MMKSTIHVKNVVQADKLTHENGVTNMSKLSTIFKHRKLQMFAVSSVAMAMLVMSLPSISTFAHADASSLTGTAARSTRHD